MTNTPANTARTGRRTGGRYLCWRVTFCLGFGVLTAGADGIDGVSLPRSSRIRRRSVPEAIPPVLRPPHPARCGGCGLRRSRLLRLLHVSFSPIMRDESACRERYISIGLVIYGCACLWSNLYGGKLADRSWRGTIDPHSTDLLRVGRLPVSAGFRLAAGGWHHDLLRPYVER